MENHLLSQIVTWESLDECCDGFIQVFNATFKQDFGPWKKGQVVESLAMSYEDSELVDYRANGDRNNVCKLKLVPEVTIES